MQSCMMRRRIATTFPLFAEIFVKVFEPTNEVVSQTMSAGVIDIMKNKQRYDVEVQQLNNLIKPISSTGCKIFEKG